MATRTICVAFAAWLLAAPETAQAQRLQLDALDRLAARASETVNINIDPEMLRFALPFMKGQGNEPELKAMLSQLQGIYVRVFEFDANVDTSSEMNAIRKQLTAPGWVRFMGVDSRRDGEFVEMYNWRQGDSSGGLAILVSEPNELVIVNIVGRFDPSMLPALRGLGIPDLSR